MTPLRQSGDSSPMFKVPWSDSFILWQTVLSAIEREVEARERAVDSSVG